jgi:hypothetical protein
MISVPGAFIEIDARDVGNHIYLGLAARNDYEIRVLDCKWRRRRRVAFGYIFFRRIFLLLIVLRILLLLLVLLLRILLLLILLLLLRRHWFCRRIRLGRLGRFNNYGRRRRGLHNNRRRRHDYYRRRRHRDVDTDAECKAGRRHAGQKRPNANNKGYSLQGNLPPLSLCSHRQRYVHLPLILSQSGQ